MKVIGIETSGMHGGIALLEDNRIRRETDLKSGMVHGKLLIPALKKAISQSRWALDDIDLIAVDIGPGSYTGLRVGLAAAKMMAYLLDKPIIGISSLDAMVNNVKPSAEFACPVIDARWHQVYAAIYRPSNSTKDWERITDYLAATPEDLTKILKHHCSESGQDAEIFGDGLLPYKNTFTMPGVKLAAEKHWYPRASNIAKLGRIKWLAGKRDDCRKLLPLYLRLTEAEITMKKKQKAV